MKFVTVGKLKEAHGLRGEFYVVLFAKKADWLPKLKTVRLVKVETEQRDVQHPEVTPEHVRQYTIKSTRAHKAGLILSTLESRDRNHAESIEKWFLQIPEEYLVAEVGEQPFLVELEGAEVSVVDRGVVGTVIGFSSNGAQDLLVVKTEAGTYEIPFVDAFVEKINWKTKKILMDLPIGLLGELDDEEVVVEADSDDDAQETTEDEASQENEATSIAAFNGAILESGVKLTAVPDVVPN